jgi:hypothetical protein
MKSLFALLGRTSLAVIVGGIMAAGALGSCFAGQPSNPNVLRNPAVFNAAPLSSIRTGGVIVVLRKTYPPPPYCKVTFDSAHPSQETPSTRYLMLDNFAPLTTRLPSGGTTGSAPSICINVRVGADVAGDCCANVEVWFPTSNTDMAPSVNDPNASVTFDISPPENGECGKWKWHYGEHPPE